MRTAHLNTRARSRLRACVVAAAIPLLVAVSAVAQTASRITLDQAIQLALKNNPALQAARTQIDQNRAQEVTAGLRPNPLLSWDSQFMPIFHPSLFSADTLNSMQQFDMGVGYLFERGQKRQRRLDAARDQTRVTQAQIVDAERLLTFTVAQEFINVLLAKSDLEFAIEDLKSFRATVSINEDRYKAGDISQGDLLKTKIQLLQFETDVTSARLAKVQALASLRQLIGYDAVPRDYDVIGDLEYAPITSRLDDLEATALARTTGLARRAVGSQCRKEPTGAGQGQRETGPQRHARLLARFRVQFRLNFFQHPAGGFQPQPGRDRTHALRARSGGVEHESLGADRVDGREECL